MCLPPVPVTLQRRGQRPGCAYHLQPQRDGWPCPLKESYPIETVFAKFLDSGAGMPWRHRVVQPGPMSVYGSLREQSLAPLKGAPPSQGLQGVCSRGRKKGFGIPIRSSSMCSKPSGQPGMSMSREPRVCFQWKASPACWDRVAAWYHTNPSFVRRGS